MQLSKRLIEAKNIFGMISDKKIEEICGDTDFVSQRKRNRYYIVKCYDASMTTINTFKVSASKLANFSSLLKGLGYEIKSIKGCGYKEMVSVQGIFISSHS